MLEGAASDNFVGLSSAGTFKNINIRNENVITSGILHEPKH
jgi:hypothetical protein